MHHHINSRHLQAKGLTDYWGYNTLAFFAPDTRYASARQSTNVVREFKRMVRALHQAGLAVLALDMRGHGKSATPELAKRVGESGGRSCLGIGLIDFDQQDRALCARHATIFLVAGRVDLERGQASGAETDSQ